MYEWQAVVYYFNILSKLQAYSLNKDRLEPHPNILGGAGQFEPRQVRLGFV